METISWDDLRILLAIQRAGSLLAAGRSLGLSTSTAARRLDALEAAFGRQLVHRSRTGAALNADAEQLVRLAMQMEHGLGALRRDETILAGRLRVSVPEGTAHLLSLSLLAFHRLHPNVDIELVGENRMADVAAREVDIAVRLTRSTSNVLVEKHLASPRFCLLASSDYVRTRLPQQRLETGEAARHVFVGLDPRWRDLPHEKWLRELGAHRFVFRSTSMEAIVEAVRGGAGMGAFLEHDPRTAGLERIATALQGPEQAFYLVYHQDLRKQAHVRAAVAVIEAAMRAGHR